jgi:hypothetical protein
MRQLTQSSLDHSSPTPDELIRNPRLVGRIWTSSIICVDDVKSDFESSLCRGSLSLRFDSSPFYSNGRLHYEYTTS